MGIFPDTVTGGAVVYRDATGAPLNPPGVSNAYPPAPAFTTTCELTALPSDCDARVEPKQINALVSELISFAECLNPTGDWDCNSVQNLCANFNEWVIANLGEIFVGVDPPPSPPPNKLWWETDTGILYIWYNDGSSTQWVQVLAGNTLMFDGVSIVGIGTTSSPYAVGTIDCGSY